MQISIGGATLRMPNDTAPTAAARALYRDPAAGAYAGYDDCTR